MAEHEFGAIYGDGTNSSIGKQHVPFHIIKKALIDTAPARIFSQFGTSVPLPKHQGKTLVRDRYIPLLNDENINNEGIDATANHDEFEVTIIITKPEGTYKYYAVGQGKTGQALPNAKKVALDLLKNLRLPDATGSNYDTVKTALEGKGWKFEEGEERPNYGNMYGSSRDIGVITQKMPLIPETGGRINRVGFKRVSVSGTIRNYGFYREYTEDSLNFDNDAKLYEHITNEALKAANQITEDQLQIDLLNGAGLVGYGGDAVSLEQVTGENGSTPSVLTYDSLTRLHRMLNDENVPINTKIVSGSSMTDTKTIDNARYAFIGSELVSTLYKMKDYHGEKAFIPARQYANAGSLARGEIGAVDHFRFIEVPQMVAWRGKGATVTNNDGYWETNGKYDVFPMLVVGSDSFNTINFEHDGTKSSFKILNKKPGIDTMGKPDPYGKSGIWSIQWWYGIIIHRPEHIAVMKVVAER